MSKTRIQNGASRLVNPKKCSWGYIISTQLHIGMQKDTSDWGFDRLQIEAVKVQEIFVGVNQQYGHYKMEILLGFWIPHQIMHQTGS